jgi:hypothetical protein
MNDTLLLQLSAVAVVCCETPIEVIDDDLKDPPDEGPDAYGRYYGNVPFIAIDRKKCCSAAPSLKCNPSDIVKVVLVHELAHYVSHRGIGIKSGKTWMKFDSAGHMEVERMAQGLCYLWIKQFGNETELATFQQLGVHCKDDAYRQWDKEKINGQINPHRLEDLKFHKAWAKMFRDLHETSGRLNFKLADAGVSPEDQNTVEGI